MIGRVTAGIAALVVLLSSRASAQTDFYNTDAGRPGRIEDASAMEHRSVELQLAPLRLERERGGLYQWGIEPEIAIGLLPRTQFELRLPLVYTETSSANAAGTRSKAGLGGVDLSVLYNLNVETRLPALAVAVDALLPVGSMAPKHAYVSFKGIVTRTFPMGRVHVNAQYTAGPGGTPLRGVVDPLVGVPGAGAATTAGAHDGELTRWLAGVAADHSWPLRSVLVSAEVFAAQPLRSTAGVAPQAAPQIAPDIPPDIEWNAGVGSRYQYSPRWALDAGVGKNVSRANGAWYFTVGGAYAIGLPWHP